MISRHRHKKRDGEQTSSILWSSATARAATSPLLGCLCCILASLAAGTSRADDWPVYRHDNNRSGATAERLPAKDLKLAWSRRSPIPSQPAWDGPARWDAYRRQAPLPATRNYDVAFQPVVVGECLYFGSSADDSVHCLDLKTGTTKWTFTTGGPVRIAPACVNGKVFFGSDDGWAYCVSADAGKLLWRFAPEPAARLVLQDGRFVSPRACRSGVAVVQRAAGGPTAYFAASLLPWEDSYLCAVDAETGKAEGSGRFVRRIAPGAAFDGPLSSFSDALYCPRGSQSPLVYRREQGLAMGGIWAAQAGHFFLAIPEEDRFLCGGMAFKGIVGLIDATICTPPPYTYVMGAVSAAYRNGTLVLMNAENVSAVDRKSKRTLWNAGGGPLFCVIIAGDSVFAGGDNKVLAWSLADGKPVWEAPVAGQVHGLAVAGGALLASTDQGEIRCFRPGPPAAPVVPAGNPARPAVAPPAKNAPGAQNASPKPASVELSAGPSVRFVTSSQAQVLWQTPKPTPTILVYGQPPRIFRDDRPTTDHRAPMEGLPLRGTCRYQIKTADDAENGTFTLDTHWNYSIPDLPKAPWPFAEDPFRVGVEKAAEFVLATAKPDQGLCLVLGAADGGHLAWKLATGSKLRVVVVESDPQRVAAARERLLRCGAYGARVAVLQVDDLRSVPLPAGVFQLIVSSPAIVEGQCVGDAAEVFRLLKPLRGMALIGQPAGSPARLSGEQLESWLKTCPIPHRTTADAGGLWATILRSESYPGAQPWTHQYALPGNTACSDDTLQGAAGMTQMVMQWMGRPGPRYQADRMNRKPAPLAAGGRLFMQGLGNLFCLDAHNGTVLWSLDVPGLVRFNMPRDASNYCTDGDSLFVAVRDKCWCVAAATGDVTRHLDVLAAPGRNGKADWGYVGVEGQVVLGTATAKGTARSDYWGSGSWFEHGGWEKACSDSLFAYDKRSGARKWLYADGVIINTTVTVADGRVYFVESRDKRAIASTSRVLNGGELWDQPVLVALDLDTGRRLWERTFEPGQVPPGNCMFSLVCAGGKLVLDSCNAVPVRRGQWRGSHFVFAFEASSGKDAWKTTVPWPGYGHGVHMSRPVVVGDTLYLVPATLELATGRVLPAKPPRGACGTTSASRHALFYRLGVINIWDRDTQDATAWTSVRPDCWLSTIPAEGLLLAPEGGGGCVCACWLETSAALAPRTDLPLFKTPPRQFIAAMDVELAPPVGGGILRYTTDGTDPLETSSVYNGKIRITGTTVVRARVVGAPCGPRFGPVVGRRYEQLAGARPASAKVKFQPPGITETPAACLIDLGLEVAIQDGGCAYGWREAQAHWPNLPAESKDLGKGTCTWLNARNTWEMAVDNGEYEVAVRVGHPGGETKLKDAGTFFVCGTSYAPEKDLAKGELMTIVNRVKATEGKLQLYKTDKLSLGIQSVEYRRL